VESVVKLPDEVFQAVNNPKAGKVLATVGADGTPHVIEVGSIMAPSPDMVAFGAIIMKETGKNLERAKSEKTKISILVTVDLNSYLINAKIADYITKGPIYDKMNDVLKGMGLKANGVWMVQPTDVWNESARYEGGKKMV
jgi:hypothetical protein